MAMDIYNTFTVALDTNNLPTKPQAQALGNTGANSSQEIDLGAGLDAFHNVLANPDIGMGKPVFANIVVDESVTVASAGGTATTTFELWGAPDNGGVSGVYAQLDSTPALTITQLNGKYKTFFAVPPGAPRYLKIINTVGVQNFTAGQYFAWLSGEPLPTE